MLKSIMPGTDRPKTFAEFSDDERKSFARECYDTQFQNLRVGWPVDDKAIKYADGVAESSNDFELLTTRDTFRGFRRVREGDKGVLTEALAEAKREIARLSKAK